MEIISRWPIYRLYGLTLASDFPFASRLQAATGPIDLCFHSHLPASFEAPARPENLLYKSPVLTPDGQPASCFYRAPGIDQFQVPKVGDCFILDKEIIARPEPGAHGSRVETHFLSSALPYYLERSGVLVLHASACTYNGRAIAFLGSPSTGKSTMVAGLVHHKGASFLTDDRLPIHLLDREAYACPSLPTLRLKEQAVSYLLGDPARWRRLDPEVPKYLIPIGNGGIGTYRSEEARLDRIYLLIRRLPQNGGSQVKIEPVPMDEAIVTLIRHSALPRLVHALGWHVRRLDQLSLLLRTVSFRRLIYPHGFEHLPIVYDSVIKDLSRD